MSEALPTVHPPVLDPVDVALIAAATEIIRLHLELRLTRAELMGLSEQYLLAMLRRGLRSHGEGRT